jgi:hypothetical protein
MAYDSARGVTVLFGGYDDYQSQDDTWEWDGASWTQVADTNPWGRYDHAIAYDSARGVTVLFGGWYGYDDTWEWTGPWDAPAITQQPADQNVPVGGTAIFTVAAVADDFLSYPWRWETVLLEDDGRISGATTDTLTIDPVQPGDAGRYDVVVSISCGGVTSELATLTVEGGCPGDLDGDGDTDQSDLGLLLTDWGCTSDCVGDLDGDDDTDQSDLGLLISDWGCGW